MAGLFGSSVLEVAIGLSFIYFLLSLICSQINEILAGLLKWRARDLELGIQNLLCDPEIAEAVLNHPLIKAMGNDGAETLLVRLATLLRLAPSRAGKPGYISSNTFVQALFDQLAPAAGGLITIERLRRRAQELANTLPPPEEPKQTIRAPKDLLLWWQQRERLQQQQDEFNGKRSIGRAVLSLLDQSAPTQTSQASATDVKKLVEQADEPRKQFAALLQTAQSPGEIRAMAMALPESDLRAAVLKLLGTAQPAGAAAPATSTAGPTVDAVKTLVETLFPQLSGYAAIDSAVNKTLDDIRAAVAALPQSAMVKRIAALLDPNTDPLEKFNLYLQSIEDSTDKSALTQVDRTKTLAEIRAAVAQLAQSGNEAAKLAAVLLDQKDSVEAVRTYVQQLPESVEQRLLAAALEPEKTLDDIRKALLTLPESNLRTTVLTFIDQGQASMEAARKTVETWYNNAMDRVSGVYKRRIQMWLLGIGLVVVVFIGADTLKIATVLASNTDLRTAIAARADATVASGASDLPGATAILSSRVMTTTSAMSNTTTVTTTLTTAISNTNGLLAELGPFSELFGYHDVLVLLDDKVTLPDTHLTCRADATWWQEGACWATLDWRKGTDWILWKLLGLAITVFAVSLGAPFWFDLLKKIVNLRTSGKPPEAPAQNPQGQKK